MYKYNIFCPFQKQICTLDSCSGATAVCISVRWPLLMIWKGKMKARWSYWCRVSLMSSTLARFSVWSCEETFLFLYFIFM